MEPPGPQGAGTVAELGERLRLLHAWSGLSYREVHRRVVRSRRDRGVPELPALNTVFRCLQPGRHRLDADLVVDVAAALLGDQELATGWRQAYRVVTGRAAAASVVSVRLGLPDDDPVFVGRAAELGDLLTAGPGAVSVEGMAGVGKTTLAIRAAHRLVAAGRFAGLQLSVNLRGHDSERPAADPAAVLDAMLRLLGCPPHRLQGLDLRRRTARYREVLAGRRALILLDDAADEEQVLPLLPPDDSCLALITSRRRLATLPSITLDVFSADEAIGLLSRTAGEDRIAVDPRRAGSIAEAVGHLPLALALAGSRIRSAPEWSLADHLERLVEHRESLHLDGAVDVALRLSYDALPAHRRRLLRMVALHPGQDCDDYAAAALSGMPIDDARSGLAALAAASLVRQRVPGRFRMHDLVRVFAMRRGREEDPSSGRRAALGRLLRYYRHCATTAVTAVLPHQAIGDFGEPGTAVPDLSGVASEWLDRECSGIVATAIHGAEHGWGDITCDLSELLHDYLVHAARPYEALALHEAAARLGAERALIDLAAAQMWFGRYAEASAGLRRAAGRTDDRELRAVALLKLSSVQWRMGDYAGCEATVREVLAVAAETDDRHVEFVCRTGLGEVLWRFGRFDEAQREHQRCLLLARELGDRDGEALSLARSGRTWASLERYDEAFRGLDQALAMTRDIGNRVSEGYVLLELGAVHTLVGRPGVGIPLQRRAAAIGDEVTDPFLRVTALNELTGSLREDGQYAAALDCGRQALCQAEELDALDQQATAHDQLARTLAASGRPGEAERHRLLALALHRRMGTPEARVGATTVGSR